jgi:hypothetical protein
MAELLNLLVPYCFFIHNKSPLNLQRLASQIIQTIVKWSFKPIVKYYLGNHAYLGKIYSNLDYAAVKDGN